ncbi:MAG: pyruvate, phosphate dikinase [Alphaproteobacteria bacterium]|jgi:pyruvate,orthophosphate dikinase|nr:pyruvate, phosphate dikinase [Alphaproteobacteria bacterium]
MTKWVYRFGGDKSEGNSGMRNLLGGKGANLAEMASLGLPVPPGFTITTEVCTAFYDNNRQYPEGLKDQVAQAMAWLEEMNNKSFGDEANPLLVSIRSGARASMPGMMDTVLNLGLNDSTVEGLAKKTGDERFAYDSYRRFIQMYSNVVLGVEHYHFEDVLEAAKAKRGAKLDTELTAQDLKDLVLKYKDVVKNAIDGPFPEDPEEQLWGGIGAVFGSWMNQRAATYRKLHDIPASWGTAVNVQSMVFGNLGNDCATGVAFTRNPSTGENAFYGEYLVNAQGEDVVAGIRTPQPISLAAKAAQETDLPAMEEVMPKLYDQLCEMRTRLETHYKEMQDLEFTIEKDTLYLLQTRNGKRTTPAALRIAVEMCEEGMIDEREAVSRIPPASLDQLLHPTLDPTAKRDLFGRGLPASPGACSGTIVFSADDAESKAQLGETVILVREETSPEDIHGMHAAAGILTTRGGMTSHAAVVARGMGRPCVCGAGELHVNYKTKTVTTKDKTLKEGDVITLDGATGEVMIGSVPTIQPELSGDFAKLMTWADKIRRMKVRTNAETKADCETARKFGAEGIGLCRTEHMFFEADRITAVRRMIVAETEADRRKALDEIQPMQKQDFKDIFTVMRGLPVTIRLLDPPLHEFLPKTDADMEEVARVAGTDVLHVSQRSAQLHEANPMLGHRGCRLGVTYPEISEMQARAIFEAAVEIANETGEPVIPEVMIPLAFSKKEIDLIKDVIDRTAHEVQAATGKKFEYLVGTMIELPRAALMAGEIAQSAQFFSFGTNDLTQTTFGISRDDAAHFLPDYERVGIFEHDPFVTLDQEGVGQLVKLACERGKATRPDIKLGICGEHGGDPASVIFCNSVGLDYVSCSPYRVPIARLAAAQAAISSERRDSTA